MELNERSECTFAAHVRAPPWRTWQAWWPDYGALECRVRLCVIDLLQIAPNDGVLEVGFGPGVVTERLTKRAPAGRVAGVDHSIEMVELARARKITAIQKSGVDLQMGVG